MTQRLIKVKLPKAILYLTVEEFEAAIKRGKAILRAQQLRKRLDQKDKRVDNR